jgi:hypothetical protein
MLIDYRASISARRFIHHIGIRAIPPHVVKDGKVQPGVGEPLVLLPGVQKVDAKAWDDVKEGAGTKELLATQQLRILPDKFDFAKAPPFEQQDLVERTIDVDVLKDWKRQLQSAPPSNRQHHHTVLSKLDEQITLCTTDVHGKVVAPKKVRLVKDGEQARV